MSEKSYRMDDGVLVENTAEEIAAIEELRVKNAAEAVEDLKVFNRQKRNDLLAACDWTQANDSPLSNDKKIEWATYRTALRDLPSNKSWPDVTFPTEPS